MSVASADAAWNRACGIQRGLTMPPGLLGPCGGWSEPVAVPTAHRRPSRRRPAPRRPGGGSAGRMLLLAPGTGRDGVGPLEGAAERLLGVVAHPAADGRDRVRGGGEQ